MVSSSAPPQLNPFYIEPEWEGDWRSDTDYLEEENDDFERLLPRDQHHLHPNAAVAASHRHHRHPTKKRRVTRLRVGVLCFLLFLLFLALLSMTSSKTTSNETSSTTDNESVMKTAQPSTVPAASPSPVTPPHLPTVTRESSPPTRSPQKQKIIILGERTSGVKQLENHLQECYPQVTISTRLDRDAFWFQDGPSASSSSSAAAKDDALQHFWLVLMVRHPIDWVYEMWKNPIYMPSHTNLALSEFRTKLWTMPRSKRDEQIVNTTAIKCQMHFKYDRVIPCLPDEGGSEAVYELNNESKPFSSILALRRAKLLHVLNEVTVLWKDFVLNQNVVVLHYEGTLRDHVRTLEMQTNLPAHACRDLDASFLNPSSDVPTEHVRWMNDRVDWKVEDQVGYSPRKMMSEPTTSNSETNPTSSPAPKTTGDMNKTADATTPATNQTNMIAESNTSQTEQPSNSSPGELVVPDKSSYGTENVANSTADGANATDGSSNNENLHKARLAMSNERQAQQPKTASDPEVEPI